MRIAQLAPLAESVPPKLYGGTERVVSWLTEELISLGCEVTLFASGDSVTRANLIPACNRALRLGRSRPDPYVAYAAQLGQLSERINQFDVIHSHIDWLHLPLLSSLGAPFLTTLHGRLDLPGLGLMLDRFSSAPFVSISDSQRRPLPNARWLATVHHGMPPDLLSFCTQPEGYLAFLGRISAEKGPKVAIRVATSVGMPLRIAAKIPRGGNAYFNQHIKPFADGRRVEFIGEVGEQEKSSFLGNASALLFPIDWPEPFGLVMIEAMACGTPVIAWRRGAVPEIIEDGVTGFIVETETQAIDAIGRIPSLDRHRIRAEFERRFTARRMAEDYVRCYQAVADCARSRHTAPVRRGRNAEEAVPDQTAAAMELKGLAIVRASGEMP
jgi:glycosyltransferase involved in cell wall biosynthesis